MKDDKATVSPAKSSAMSPAISSAMSPAIGLTICLIAAVLLAGAGQAASAELVREFSGSRSTTTAEFSVDGPWLLDWRLDGDTSFNVKGDYRQRIALDITLVDARSGLHIGRVKETKFVGNGLRLFEQGGRYKLRVSSTLGRWKIKIQQLTPEEAERYTPRDPGNERPWYELD